MTLAGQGWAGQGKAGQGSARRGLVGRGMAWRGKARAVISVLRLLRGRLTVRAVALSGTRLGFGGAGLGKARAAMAAS